jgi:hypothetical protein
VSACYCDHCRSAWGRPAGELDLRIRRLPPSAPGHEDILCDRCKRVVPLDEIDWRVGVVCGLPMFSLNRLTLCRACPVGQPQDSYSPSEIEGIKALRRAHDPLGPVAP